MQETKFTPAAEIAEKCTQAKLGQWIRHIQQKLDSADYIAQRTAEGNLLLIMTLQVQPNDQPDYAELKRQLTDANWSDVVFHESQMTMPGLGASAHPFDSSYPFPFSGRMQSNRPGFGADWMPQGRPYAPVQPKYITLQLQYRKTQPDQA